jgi:hypothetical protein
MNLNAMQILGLGMIVFAFGMQVFVPGAVVYYSSVAPSASFTPAGTSPNSPYYLQSGQTYTCTAVIAGIQPAELSSVTVQISIWTGSAWNLLGTYTLAYMNTIVGLIYYGYNFTTGASPGSLYALSYLVQTTDVGSFSGMGYIGTQNNLGYFCINGVMSSNITTMHVTNPLLTFTYTVNVSGINYANIAVFIKVLNGSTLLTQVNLTPPTNGQTPANFTGSYMLPTSGTYVLNGYVTYNGATTQQMSIVDSFGDLSQQLTSTISLTDFYLVIGLFGCLFIFLGARQKKEK